MMINVVVDTFSVYRLYKYSSINEYRRQMIIVRLSSVPKNRYNYSEKILKNDNDRERRHAVFIYACA